jgi:hypothetical protein
MAYSARPGMEFTELPLDARRPSTERLLPDVEVAGASDVSAPGDLDGDYVARVRGMIEDAREFNAEILMPIRVRGIRLYLGIDPQLDDEGGTSTIVKTEVRDTVLQMLPSLMRIFTGQDQVTNFIPNNKEGVEQAQQATDYIGYVFHRDNPGYMILQDCFKDGMVKAMGVATWWTDDNKEIIEEQYERLTLEQRQGIISQEGTEVVSMNMVPKQGPGGEVIPTFDMVVRYTRRTPRHRVASVPPDEFRINRLATCVKDAALVGRERFATKSELILKGVDPELINDNQDFSGGDLRFTEERMLRNMGSDSPFGRDSMEPLVRYGDYYIRVDKNLDGVAELRHICTVGDGDIIVTDEPVSRARYAICCCDPEPHSIVGHGVSELVADLQIIGTNMLRGALDSMASAIYPRMMGVENMVDWDDVLNQAIGAPIRVKDINALKQLDYRFIGGDVFTMMEKLDQVRMQRTGITEQSKGLDPKALQSTTLKGVDMIVQGAQERIELVARTMASTFMVDLMSGLLQEIVDKPVPERVIQLRGEYVPIQPSRFDATMICVPNPAMGRGSDLDRYLMLNMILGKQELIIQQGGPLNPLVTPIEYRNAFEDILSIAGMKNSTRYFKAVTPEAMQQLATQLAAKEDPNLIYAKAEGDKVRAQVIKTLTDARTTVEDLDRKDDRERDKFEGQQMLDAAKIDAQYGAAVDTAAIRALWSAPRVPPTFGPAGPDSGGGDGGPPGIGGAPSPLGAMPVPGPPKELPDLPQRTALGSGPPIKPEMPGGLLSGSPFAGAA